MPIIDYVRFSKKAEKDFFDNSKISDANKESMRKYLAQYTVSPATRLKFFKHIRFVLEKLSDFEIQIQDRWLINNTFKSLREKLGSGYFATLINVSKSYAKWLNDGDLPKGFKDIKSVSKKDQQRDLNPQDMWSWDDGKLFCKFTNSVQLQAVFMTQLDGGFRPSEFIDLNYGDVIKKNGVILFRVKGKTGSRVVACQRCIPWFLSWYDAHPSKKCDDPLWVMEFAEKSHQKEVKDISSIRRYDYYALKKRVVSIVTKSKIVKPCDFYTLRHSSCTLDKKDNVPLDVASERHGHTVKYFTEVYGRLDVDGVAERLRKHYAGRTERQCEVCDKVNDIGNELCIKCNSPLTVKKALELQDEQKSRIDSIESQLKAFIQFKAPDLLKKNRKELIEEESKIISLIDGRKI